MGDLSLDVMMSINGVRDQAVVLLYGGYGFMNDTDWMVVGAGILLGLNITLTGVNLIRALKKGTVDGGQRKKT